MPRSKRELMESAAGLCKKPSIAIKPIRAGLPVVDAESIGLTEEWLVANYWGSSNVCAELDLFASYIKRASNRTRPLLPCDTSCVLDTNSLKAPGTGSGRQP